MSEETNSTEVEIDDLLGTEEPEAAVEAATEAVNASQGGGISSFPGLSSFDFSQPHNISRQFEKNLLTMCENFGKSASLGFTSQLRANTAIRFNRLDLVTYGDFSRDLPKLTAVSIASLPPLSGLSLLHFDLGMVYLMIMRLLGGPIEEIDVEHKFTDIELGIGQMITERMLQFLGEGASKLVTLEPEFMHMENNPTYLGIMAPNDAVVVLNFDICIEDLEGPMRFCIPMTAFEPVMGRFDPEENSEYRSPAEVQRDRLMLFEALKGTGAEVVVNLAEIDMTFQQILELQEGDTIPLYKSLNSPLVLQVQGKPMFRGLTGKMNQNRALKLTESLMEDD